MSQRSSRQAAGSCGGRAACQVRHLAANNEHDTGSVGTESLQKADQTKPIVNTNGSNEAPPSIAETSEQTLALLTASASSLSDLGEGGPVIADISKFTTVKIPDKRSSPSGVEYKCELEPLWMAADLVERAQMGRVRIRSYENGLIRAGCLETLRVAWVGKRKHVEQATFNLRSGPLQTLVYLATKPHESGKFSFPSLRLNSLQATSRGQQPILDEGADENGQKTQGKQHGYVTLPLYQPVTN